MLPNLSSLIASVLFSAIGYGIGALAALQFLGLGDLYVGQLGHHPLLGAEQCFVAPGGVVAVRTGRRLPRADMRSDLDAQLRIDEVTNPRLRTFRERTRGRARLVRREAEPQCRLRVRCSRSTG